MATSPESSENGFDSDLAEELEQLESYSYGDHVEVKITGVERQNGEKVTVGFTPPLGSEFEREMDVPVDPSMETEFTRLLREAGRNYSNASEIVDDRVPAKYTDDGWVIQYSEPDYSIRERLSNLYQEGVSKQGLKSAGYSLAALGTFIYWPVTGIVFAAVMFGNDDSEDLEIGPGMDFIISAFFYVIGLGFWLIASLVVKFIAASIGFQFPVEVNLIL